MKPFSDFTRGVTTPPAVLVYIHYLCADTPSIFDLVNVNLPYGMEAGDLAPQTACKQTRKRKRERNNELQEELRGFIRLMRGRCTSATISPPPPPPRPLSANSDLRFHNSDSLPCVLKLLLPNKKGRYDINNVSRKLTETHGCDDWRDVNLLFFAGGGKKNFVKLMMEAGTSHCDALSAVIDIENAETVEEKTLSSCYCSSEEEE